MKKLRRLALLVPFIAALVYAPASSQSSFFFPQTPQMAPNCIYAATPLPYPSPTGPTAMTLHCDSQGNLLSSGSSGGGNVTIVGPVGAHGGVVVEGVASGVAIPVTGSFSTTVTFPYNLALGQTAQSASAIGVGGVFNTVLPTLTTGQYGTVQLDSSGRQITVLGTAIPAGANTIGAVTQASGPWTSNVTQVGGASLALGQTTMSASLPVAIASNQGALSVLPPLTGVSGTGTAAAANQMLVAGCVFTSAFPTITTGNVGPNQCNASGAFYADLGFSGGVALGAMANYGTSPGAVKVLGVNAFVTNTVAITPPLSGASGNQGAGAAGQMIVGGCVFTSAFPTITTANVAPVQCNASGQQVVDLVSAGGVALGATANYGTSPGAVKALSTNAFVTSITLPLTGANSTGTASAAGQAVVADCNFTTAPATVTTTDVVPISCNNKGSPIVDLGYSGGVALGAMANFGTSPGAVKALQANVDLNSVLGTALGAPTAVGTTGSGNVLTINTVANAATVGGSTLFKTRSLAGTVTSVKGSAGTLYGVRVYNGSAATAFVQVFNVVTGSVTLGTTTPDEEVACATLTYCYLPIGGDLGEAFGTAISVASTTAEGGNTGSAAGVQVWANFK